MDFVRTENSYFITSISKIHKASLCPIKNVTGSGKRAHLAQVINFQFIALSERTHFVLSNAL